MSINLASDKMTSLAYSYQKIVITRLFTEALLIFLMQYAGIQFTSLFFPVWFATGTACVFIFLRGYSIIPAIAFGNFCGFISLHFSVKSALFAASLFTLQPIILFMLSAHFIQPSLIFYQRSALFLFFTMSAIVTAMTSYLFTVLIHAEVYYLKWWLANFNGIGCIAFALATLDAYFPDIDKIYLQNKIKLGASLFFLILSLICYICTQHILYIIFLIPIIFYINFNYGRCGLIAMMFIVDLLLSLAVNFDWIQSGLFLQTMLTAQTILVLYLGCTMPMLNSVEVNLKECQNEKKGFDR